MDHSTCTPRARSACAARRPLPGRPKRARLIGRARAQTARGPGDGRRYSCGGSAPSSPRSGAHCRRTCRRRRRRARWSGAGLRAFVLRRGSARSAAVFRRAGTAQAACARRRRRRVVDQRYGNRKPRLGSAAVPRGASPSGLQGATWLHSRCVSRAAAVGSEGLGRPQKASTWAPLCLRFLRATDEKSTRAARPENIGTGPRPKSVGRSVDAPRRSCKSAERRRSVPPAGLEPVELGAHGDDLTGIDGRVAHVVVALDVREVDGLRDQRPLEDVARVSP